MTRGLLVPVEGEPHAVEFDGLQDMYDLIGCELVTSVPWLFDDEPACYVDDEGKLNGAEPNRAVYQDGELVEILYGHMLFCGFDPETGEDRDISPQEVERVLERFTVGREAAGSGMAVIADIRKGVMKAMLKSRGKL